MSGAIDWQSRVAALQAALAGASGTDASIARQLVGALTSQGQLYSSLFTSEVAASKEDASRANAAALAAWTSSTITVHDQADRACRFGGAPGQALAFDGASSTAIVARLDAALALPIAAPVKALLTAHRAAVVTAYGARPSPQFAGAFSAPRRSSVRSGGGRQPKVRVSLPSVQQLEVELAATMAQADALVAELAFA